MCETSSVLSRVFPGVRYTLANPRPLSSLYRKRRIIPHRRYIRKRYVPRRRPNKTLSRYHKRTPSVWNNVKWVASKALQGVNYVRKLINVEFKNKDLDYTALAGGLNTVSAPHYVDLDTMQQGSTVSTRVGNQILAKALKLSFVINANSAGAAVQRVRYFVVNYVTNENVRPTIAELITTSLFEAPRNLDYVKQFRIISSGIISVDKTNSPQRMVSISRKLNFHVKYNGNTGDYSDVTSGLITLVLFCDQASNSPSIANFTSRFYFIDN